ncbi:MAG: hypothetical protein COV38_16430 [Bdellovibrionales bacterium CG11_big_fil_rev_8_21_14_0_20_38_13]|nr:MAG: hypothetical protein COV38_16430 [Bdellovibrionales bacterium CG11_big_fil_rev_8_21_14_0_20_38_13]
MLSRRFFLKAAISLSSAAYASSLLACDISTLKKNLAKIFDSSSSTAKRLDFVSVAEESKNSKYKKGDKCGACSFFNDKKGEGDFAPCSFASNRFVPSCGWCKQYKKDPKKGA